MQDFVQDHAKHIDELLAAARSADAEVQRLAAGARYAGDPQPYRLTHDEPVEPPAGAPASQDRDMDGVVAAKERR